MFFESSQTSLQYFCLSAGIQLQAGCAHFFTSVIGSPLVGSPTRWYDAVRVEWIRCRENFNPAADWTDLNAAWRKRKPQISPLRYAPVEMTNLLRGVRILARELRSIA